MVTPKAQSHAQSAGLYVGLSRFRRQKYKTFGGQKQFVQALKLAQGSCMVAARLLNVMIAKAIA
jgi:hypothetical protein